MKQNVIFRALILLVFSFSIQAFLISAHSTHPFKVAEEAFFNSILGETAVEPSIDFSALVIEVDESFCDDVDLTKNSHRFKDCHFGSKVDRTRIAKIIQNIQRSDTKLLVMNLAVEPYNCDQGALAVVKSILDFSRDRPVIYPHSLIGNAETFVLGPTIFSSCFSELDDIEQRFLLNEANIYFGHARLSGVASYNSNAGVYLTVNAVSRVNKEEGEYAIIQIPALGFLGNELLSENFEKKLQDMNAGGVFFKYRPNLNNFVERKNFCISLNLPCEKTITNDQFLEMSFQWKQTKFNQKGHILSYLASRYNVGAARDINTSLIGGSYITILSAQKNSLGDNFISPQGQSSGGQIIAQSLLDFSQNSFISREQVSYFKVLISSFLIAALIGTLTFWSVKQHSEKMRKSSVTEFNPAALVNMHWPMWIVIVVGLLLVIQYFNILNSVKSGLLTIGFAAMFASLFDLIPAVQSILDAVLNKTANFFKKIVVSVKSYSEEKL